MESYVWPTIAHVESHKEAFVKLHIRLCILHVREQKPLQIRRRRHLDHMSHADNKRAVRYVH